MPSTDAQPLASPRPGLRAALGSLIASLITSTTLRDGRRRRQERSRQRRGRPHEVHYFHQVDDPYSALTAQKLAAFIGRYDVQLIPHLVPPPPDWAAPDRPRLDAYALRDARAVAVAFGLAFEGRDRPGAEAVARAQSVLCNVPTNQFPEAAAEVSRALWTGRSLNAAAARFGEAGRVKVDEHLRAGAELRGRAGHYLGATFLYAGEWYWGLDRLDHLESRLTSLGADREPGSALIAARPPLQFVPVGAGAKDAPPLEIFLSLRSPYSWLAIDRARALADHYGLMLVIKPLLPMVMRGLKVPRAKRLYIVRDCKREADSLGLDFGRICDPVGAPVERGLAVLVGAQRSGRDAAFAASFLKGVFAQGIDAGSDRGLENLCKRAGIDWAEARNWLDDPSWRVVVEANRREMFDLSLWGVPSFRFGTVSAWGQDRLWLIENAILETLETLTGPRP